MYKVNTSAPDPGYIAEGLFYVYANHVPGSVAVYQVDNGTDHMLTYYPNEGSQIGYGNAQLMGYVFDSAATSVGGKRAQQFCRYYNPSTGDHLVNPPKTINGYNQEACNVWVWVD